MGDGALPAPPEPFGTYAEAMQTGHLLYLAGMLPTEGHEAKVTGRTLPYTRAWAEQYKDRGLGVIGVHTPEFAFEHNVENVFLDSGVEASAFTFG